MAQINFDARTVAPDEGRGDPIPQNWYIMAMTSSEIKPTKNDGHALATVFTVMEGQYKGRQVYYNMNIRNANAQTVEIAYKQLSAICHATGRLTVGDTVELHNIPLKARVKIRTGDLKDPQNPAMGKYDDQNEITSFKNVNDQTVGNVTASAPAAPAFAMPPSGAPQAAGQPAPAWQPPAQPQAAPAYAPPAQPAQAAPAWQPPAAAQPWDPASAGQPAPAAYAPPPAQPAPAAAAPWGPPA